PLSAPMPSPELWKRIAARTSPASAEPQRSALARWLERWLAPRQLGMLATGLFLGLGVSMVVAPMLQDRAGDAAQETQLPQSYAGILSDAGGVPTMLVSSLRHGRIVDIKVLRAVAVPEGQVLQLWALVPGGAPMPLGVVPPQGKGRLELPATSEQLLSKVTELAVSVSPAGAPAAVPADGFLLRGPCAKFW
ncbi:MAG TPA: anti-sigma factor, partial [Albitalea sp.]